MKKERVKEWLSLKIAKNPSRTILEIILLINLLFFVLAAFVISRLAPSSLRDAGFWASVYYTITMILDAGCISYVVEDVGTAGVSVIITCIVIVIVGSITFTGSVIGYVTNYIADFIEKSNAGERVLHLSGHTVILNWNSRASEIINDLLYTERKETVVVLVEEGRKRIETEIYERLHGTIEMENAKVRKQLTSVAVGEQWHYYRRNRLKNRVTVLVQEGDTFSTKKLQDISIMKARSIIILSDEAKASACALNNESRIARHEKGNANTVKTLIQVAEMTGNEESADNQHIVVEVEDEWTAHLVSRIIAHKAVAGKCDITPVPVNQVLGQILSQFSIMPELNSVYGELFSNKGAQFFSRRIDEADSEAEHIRGTLDRDVTAVPLARLDSEEGANFYYMAASGRDVDEEVTPSEQTVNSGLAIRLSENFWLEKRNIIILGHNSKSADVMSGFDAFRSEWNFNSPELIAANGGEEILNIRVVDDAKNLEKHDYYRGYPQVNQVIAADVFDRETICQAINEFVDSNVGDTSILILSDDMAEPSEVDANALTYLIYVRDIIAERMKANPDFDVESIDVVVEILNPKNYDIVHSYSVDNIVISNRYISKMITQIGEQESIARFYQDILTYDDNNTCFVSKELYIKKASRFFAQLPEKCTAAQLIRAVYDASPENNRSILLGYVEKGGAMHIFSGNQERIKVELKKTDKVIVFSNH